MLLQKNQAIQTALEGQWELAINLNQEILQQNPADIETLNRLAFAYTALGKIQDAKKTYQRVLEIDVFNPIALKNYKRLSGGITHNGTVPLHLDSGMYLEESGKT